MGIVFNIQKYCIHDGDGIRTCVFLKGCPLRCIRCHNPESYEKSPALSFNNQKCSSCGRCLSVCAARTVENGRLRLDRKKCVLCGKCADICFNRANEIIGKEMTASEVLTEDLLNAKANPENYRNLIVRVGGYSDYFVNLDKALQGNVIERTFAGM